MADDTLPGSVHEHAGQVQPKPDPKSPKDQTEEDIVQEVRDRYALVRSIETRQRAQEDEDLEFEAIDPWLPEHRAARARHEDETSGRVVPARPALNVPLLDQPIQQVITEARQARLGITVKPKSGRANTKIAGYYKGLIRAIQVDSGAQEVRLWALERTARCGRGAYRIETEFANDGDFDVDLVISRILDQSSVYFDPYSITADRRDAEWVIVTEVLSEEQRERLYPDKQLISPDGAFEDENELWFAVQAGTSYKTYLVADYYRIAHTTRTLAYHPQIGTGYLDDWDDEQKAAFKESQKRGDGVRTREVDVRSVERYITDGAQVLKTHREDGRYIPIITTTGKEYFVKGRRIWKGMIRPTMDVVRGYNVAVSSAVEAAGSMPRAPYIMYEGQDEGHEEMWDDAAVKSYSRLYVRAIEIGGKPAPLPVRQNLEPQIQGALHLARSMKDDIGSLTGIVDPASRAVNPYDRSGRAIEALQRQGAAGTSNYLDNLATISMMHEGRVLVDKIKHVYDRPGRVVRVMGEEETDDETAIMLKQPFVRDEEGNPVPVPCPACKGSGQKPMHKVMQMVGAQPEPCELCQGQKLATKETMPPEFGDQKVEYVDLSEGEFKVSVSIGRNHQTQQDEAREGMTELLKAMPDVAPVVAAPFVRALGFSGSTEIADRLDRVNPIPGGDDDKTKDIPPEFMAEYQQLQQQHEAAMEEIQKLKQAVETDQIKAASQEKIAEIRAAAQEQLEILKQQGTAMKTVKEIEADQDEQRLDARSDEKLEVLKGEIERMHQQAEHRHEMLLEALKIRGDVEAAKARPKPSAPSATSPTKTND